MRTNTFRGAAAAVLSIGLATAPFTQAHAAPTPTPAPSAQTPIARLSGPPSELSALTRLTPTKHAGSLGLVSQPRKSSSLAAAAGVTAMSSPCPVGQSPDALYGYQSFEDAPSPDQLNGFMIKSGAGAPEGSSWANSSYLASDSGGYHSVGVVNTEGPPPGGKVYMAFAYRGEFVEGTVTVDSNNSRGTLLPDPEWGWVALDVTSEVTVAGVIQAFFSHTSNGTDSSFDVDDVATYSCKANPTPPPAPNSGVRGDWSGQGTVDLMATRNDGTLWMYEGAGAGTVGRGVQVGSGWSTFTWQGSPGDINGDRRTDLLARRADGTLWYYPGRGYGTLGRGLQVGNGWNVMTSIATPGDFDLDGRPDLVARRSDGTLHLYRILPTGALRYVKAIGSGWNVMTSIIGMGDLNADRRGDLLAIRTDGTMFSYLSTGTGLARGTTVTAGWNIMNKLTSPGDMNKDGRGDLIARRTDGTLWFYAGRTGGGVLSGKQVGTGWNIMSNIL